MENVAHHCDDTDEYLEIVKETVRALGRSAIVPWDDAQRLLVGFKAPTGEIFQVGLNSIKGRYEGPWRQKIIKLPSGAEVTMMTRVPDNVPALWGADVRRAIEAGEALRVEA